VASMSRLHNGESGSVGRARRGGSGNRGLTALGDWLESRDTRLSAGARVKFLQIAQMW
jgi:hypothetical protein